MKTPPLSHQAKELAEAGLDPVKAIFWEQGLGKTWEALAEAELLFGRGCIDAMFVLAPNGLHANWTKYEIPPHLEVPHACLAYDTHRHAHTKRGEAEVKEFLAYREGLPILTMSYDGIKTEKGKALAKKFLTERKVFYILDESNRIKTPSAAVTKVVVYSGRYAKYKRLLCGTPIDNSPFDIYPQMQFLEKDIWERTEHGLGSFGAFKSFFANWDVGYRFDKRQYVMDKNAGKEEEICGQVPYPILASYKNMEVLKALIASLSSRLLKEDVLDLPPKLYSYSGFDLTPKQRSVYGQLEEEFMAMLDGELLAVPLALTRIMRLQQVTCNYIPTDCLLSATSEAEDRAKYRMIDPDRNPRLDILKEITADLPHKAIIWARFVQDIDLIMGLLGASCVRWDGSTDTHTREQNKARFLEDPSVQFMAATAESMGEGHTLNIAKTSIYYSSSYRLRPRLQSEDRNHRIGQDSSVHIIDIVANNTIDLRIIEALRNKFDMASMLTDKKTRSWLLTPP